MRKPLAIDLFCGLGGWTEGLLAEGYFVVGFDIEQHVYGEARSPANLVIQDVMTLHGSQFKNAALIVASPPCQEYSYMAMPWTRAKEKAAAIRADDTGHKLADLTRLFDACFRIQREACEAAGRHIPLVVENVRGAIPWVGRSRWNFGSYYLWGDVPALMPITLGRKVMKRGITHRGNGATNFHGHSGGDDGSGSKVPGFRFDGSGKSFQTASVEGMKNNGGSWFNIGGPGQKVTGQNPDGRKCDGSGWRENGSLKSSQRFVPSLAPISDEGAGIKCGGDWFGPGVKSAMRNHSSKSPARKAASAMIAKIPLPLSQHIARTFRPTKNREIAA